MNSFSENVRLGLGASPKFLSSKYIYDDNGTSLFERIMRLDEYYPTRCEKEILVEQSKKLVSLLQGSAHCVQLVELGPGNGEKIYTLLTELSLKCQTLRYYPIDVSSKAISLLVENIANHSSIFAKQLINPIVGDYIEGLAQISREPGTPVAILLLGGNIGNFNPDERIDFLTQIGQRLLKGDKICIGFDLVKSFKTIQKAYDDAQGVTAAFNKNLLERINKELGGNFDLDAFEFYATYDPFEQVVQSFLVSSFDQEVAIESLGTKYSFKRGEFIHTENSYKFTTNQIQALAESTGFKVLEFLFDSQDWFTDVVWEKL